MSTETAWRPAGPARVVALLAVTLAVVLTGCTGSAPGTSVGTVRIGVLYDCMGFFRSDADAQLSGAELPLLQRGAQRSGATPADGVTAASVVGRPVELVPGCVEGGEYTSVVEQARRLVEHDHVDVLVGGSWWWADGFALREVARRNPQHAFVLASPGPREITLQAPLGNVFRFAADHPEEIAALAPLAHDRGLRRVFVVGLDDPDVWQYATAFAAQFCARGGHVDAVTATYDDPTAGLSGWPPGADAVLVVGNRFSADAYVGLIRRLAADQPRMPILLGPALARAPAVQALPAAVRDRLLAAVAGPQPDAPRTVEYLTAYRDSFPELAEQMGLDPNAVAYRDAVEAVLTALEAVPADSPAHGADWLRALTRTTAPRVAGPTTLDGSRQAVVISDVARYDGGGNLVTAARQDRMDATLAGDLPASRVPSSTPPRCRGATDPPPPRPTTSASPPSR